MNRRKFIAGMAAGAVAGPALAIVDNECTDPIPYVHDSHECKCGGTMTIWHVDGMTYFDGKAARLYIIWKCDKCKQSACSRLAARVAGAKKEMADKDGSL